MGPQGSGKGTQARIISKKLGIAAISMGDLLRDIKGDLKKEVDKHLNKGELVPDELTIRIIKERIKQDDCKKGFILDGFPRDINQANEIEKFIKIDKVIEISIKDGEAIRRLVGRWNCKKCRIHYNLITQPRPKRDHLCDICKQPLFQRDDDINKEAVQKRLDIYHKETEPILKKYGKAAVRVNGQQLIEDVTQDIMNVLNKS